MSNTIFFSWQVDTEPKTGRNLIERALERAVGVIGEDTSVDEAVRDLAVDRDTRGVAGTPPIVDTIFRKIDAAAAFVPDLTFVGKRLGGRPTPNPNVLIEYGWALNSLGHSRMVPVMNTHYGEPTPTDMPFDMRHLRNPILYSCAPDADGATVKRVKVELARELETAIRAVLTSDDYLASQPQAPEPHPFRSRSYEGTPGRFKAMGVPIGVTARWLPGGQPHEIKLAQKPVTWFRVMPTVDPERTWLVTELQKHAVTLEPISRCWAGYRSARSHDGFGMYPTMGDDDPENVPAVVFAFTGGEVWSADAYMLTEMSHDGNAAIPSIEDFFRASLAQYADFLVKLGIDPPFRWVAGMENLHGRGIFVPPARGRMAAFPGPHGKCLVDVISGTGFYSPGDQLGQSLKPFFTKLFDSCGVERPAYLDE